MLCYLNCSVLTKPSGFLKLLQVIVSVVCMALVRHYWLNFGGALLSTDGGYPAHFDRQLFGHTCIGGMILVTLPTLVGKIFGGIEHSSLVELLQSVIGTVLFATTAGFVISNYTDSSPIADDETVKAGIALGVRSTC